MRPGPTALRLWVRVGRISPGAWFHPGRPGRIFKEEFAVTEVAAAYPT
jgi:hypothetical protein